MFIAINNRKGATLVEILTTLAVLVIGILSIARMFSGGYGLLRRSENITFASRLAEAQLEALRTNSHMLPFGITTISGYGTVKPGPPITNDNLHLMRQVVGETVKVPGPTLAAVYSGGVMGSIHNLLFAPVKSVDSVYSSPMQRRVMDSSDTDRGPWQWLRETQYAIDYEAGQICFRRSSRVRLFSISYSFWTADDNGRQLHTVVGEELMVMPGSEWIPITFNGTPVTDVSDFSIIDDRSDRVSRAFVRIDPAAGWSDWDPYQYKLLDPGAGRIAFNPLGYSYKERTPQGIEELTARIDYTVIDWGIIRERVQVPETAPLRVRTTLKYVMQNGVTVLDDGSLYAGISPADGIAQDILVLDEATGTVLPTAGGGAITVDYQNGVLAVPSTMDVAGTQTDMSGRVLKLFYRAEGYWAVQVQKAAEVYTPQEHTLELAFRDYRHPRGTKEIRFSVQDTERSFSIDYTYITPSGVERLVTGEVQRAEPAPGYSFVRLAYTPEAIRAVRGLSLKVRAIWSEGTTVVNGNPAPKWQHYDLDGELTRTSSAL